MQWYSKVVILENKDSCVRLLILLRKNLILSTNSNVIADILFHSLKTISVWFASNDDSLFGSFKLMFNNL